MDIKIFLSDSLSRNTEQIKHTNMLLKLYKNIEYSPILFKKL